MKTITIDFETYQRELSDAEFKGRSEEYKIAKKLIELLLSKIDERFMEADSVIDAVDYVNDDE